MLSGRSRVFISHSPDDEHWKTLLRQHLAPLVRAERIEIFEMNDVPPGEDITARIKREIVSADVAVCLLSASFLASASIHEHQILPLLERHASDDLMIVPVLVRACALGHVGWLKELQRLPRDGRAITDVPSRSDQDFTDIANEIGSNLPTPDRTRRSRPPQRHKRKMFICHSRSDVATAERIASVLTKRSAVGALDLIEIHPESDFRKHVIPTLRRIDEMIVLFTPRSLVGPYIGAEIGASRSRKSPPSHASLVRWIRGACWNSMSSSATSTIFARTEVYRWRCSRDGVPHLGREPDPRSFLSNAA
jgi:hypothetical protein